MHTINTADYEMLIEFNDDNPLFLFMSLDQIEAERSAIKKAICNGFQPKRQYVTTAQVAPAASQLLATLSSERLPRYAPSCDALHGAAERLTNLEKQLIYNRLCQIEMALEMASEDSSQGYQPTNVFAVNNIWIHRWIAMLSGALIPVYADPINLDSLP